MSVMYLIRAACPACETVTAFVEERESPVPEMQDVELRETEYCPNCSFWVAGEAEWDIHEETPVYYQRDGPLDCYSDTGADDDPDVRTDGGTDASDMERRRKVVEAGNCPLCGGYIMCPADHDRDCERYGEPEVDR